MVMNLQFFGGRGGSSGIGEKGFSFKRGNRTIVIQRTSAGVVLFDGKPIKLDYKTAYKNAKNQDGFKELSAKELQEMREKSYKDYNSHDYEVLPNGVRGKRKLIIRERRNPVV
ncbi:MAG: hypothetical protein ACI4HQ_01420 [Acetatifactor sp.]